MRFLLSRRWALFALAVTLLAAGCWWLGEWQFQRLEERRASNAHIARNLRAAPVPVDQVLAVGEEVTPAEQWRQVRASGRYLTAGQVVVRYQTREGQAGINVVTPLRVGATGTLLLVDRGWMPTENVGGADVDPPPPPDGRVTVTGWVRPDATGDSTLVSQGSTRAISSDAIGEKLPAPVYDGWLELASQRPPPAQTLAPTELPDLGEGPHFFYGLQWWFFGLLAVGGFGYLAWDERRKGRARARESVTTSEPSPRPPAASRH